MRYLILTGYELLTVLLPFAVVFTLVVKRDKENGRPVSLRHFLMAGVFAVYIFAVFYCTGAGTLSGLLRYGMEMHSGDQINFLPFSHSIDTVAYLQNILLFIPLGFLLPLLWPNLSKLRHALLFGLSFSLLIEISQLLSHRVTDVDDLIMNTTGALLGYLFYKLFTCLMKWNHQRLTSLKYESGIYIGALFLGHFLLYNKLGLAQLLYSF